MTTSDTRRDISTPPNEVSGFSRRSFLLTSTLAGFIGGSFTTGITRAEVDEVPDNAILTVDDLGGDYVEWRVDPLTAPLASHLSSIGIEFAPEDGTVAGFVATAAATGPKSVESAIFQIDVESARIVDAVDEWVDVAHTGTTARSTLDATAVQWVSVAESSVDVLRLDFLPGASFAVTTAAGDPEGALGPQEAVERYAKTVRNRAGVRFEATGEL